MINHPEKILTVDNFAEVTHKEKSSVFIGQVYHCETENEAANILAPIKKKYYDATHHCFAFKLITEQFKYSDDGEPNGTAGIRILNAIKHFNLINVIVVLIRYYGGTKLGVGPLGKAYYTSVYNVLEEAKKVEKVLFQKVIIRADFKYISHIHRILSNHNATIENSVYKEKVIFECYIMPSELGKITFQLTDISKGEIKIVDTEVNYYR
ncbi:MAG: YigZ family protein [Bacteroidetes bacterium]|nr:YigZ family protein [Bacteroidota bacterium]